MLPDGRCRWVESENSDRTTRHHCFFWEFRLNNLLRVFRVCDGYPRLWTGPNRT
jgi:hypothetical protein